MKKAIHSALLLLGAGYSSFWFIICVLSMFESVKHFSLINVGMVVVGIYYISFFICNLDYLRGKE